MEPANPGDRRVSGLCASILKLHHYIVCWMKRIVMSDKNEKKKSNVMSNIKQIV